MELITEKIQEIKEAVNAADRILVGLGEEWRFHKSRQAGGAYDCLYQLLKDKDYFIVTTVTDAAVYQSRLDPNRIVAPCGNATWRQCSKGCTKDIWEPGEIADDICPHCRAKLTGNTIECGHYIEEGYLPQWRAYTSWLTKTLSKRLLILELGVGFQTPTVIRWPFEKTAFFNKKAYMYRIHEQFFQISSELKGKAEGISENSVTFLIKTK